MKKNITLTLILLSIFIISATKTNKEQLPLASAKKQHSNNLASLNTALDSFEKTLKSEASQEEIQNSFLHLKNEFKKVEVIGEYTNYILISTFINATPFIKHIPKVPGIDLKDPEGIQVLEEIVFDEQLDSQNALKTFEKLKIKISDLIRLEKAGKLTDRYVLEAVRSYILRIYTLTLTAFDSPSSDSQLQDAVTGLQQIEIFIEPFTAKCSNKELKKSIRQALKGAQSFIKKSNFDSFDYVTFYKKYVSKLFSDIFELQTDLNIVNYEQLIFKLHPLKVDANHIFDEAFINAEFYHLNGKDEKYQKMYDLGKTLFFDPALSGNNKRSCASCHHPDKAFTDGLPKSVAFDFKGVVNRNAPTLVNSIYSERYFHDFRALDIPRQIENVIVNPKEFHTNYVEIGEKLSKSDEYLKKFKEIYGNYPNPINGSTVGNAIAVYIGELKSFNSPFDKFMRGEQKSIDQSVINGYNLFMGKAACGTCHFAPIFNGTVPPFYKHSETEVLGVTASTDFNNPVLDPDLGRIANNYATDAVDHFKHAFKTPTIRNIAITAPYMHNGEFNTLEEVVRFYNFGGGKGMGLDIPNQTLPEDSLGLTESEISDIVSFMEALTDTVSYDKSIPTSLPSFPSEMKLNKRKIGGEY